MQNFLPLLCVKSFLIQSYSGPYFSRFSRIRTEYGERLSQGFLTYAL